MGLQWVPIANPLKVDVAPIADSFFQPLLAIVDQIAIVDAATSFINFLNVRIVRESLGSYICHSEAILLKKRCVTQKVVELESKEVTNQLGFTKQPSIAQDAAH